MPLRGITDRKRHWDSGGLVRLDRQNYHVFQRTKRGLPRLVSRKLHRIPLVVPH